MSALKLDQPLYKLFEPGYHPQRPIIVDSDALESPDTVTLRYEEEAAVRANGGGGDLRGGSSPDLLPMAAYKPHAPQMHGFPESPYSQYSPQSLPQGHLQQQSVQVGENAASQMNQLAYAANNAAAVAANNAAAAQNSYNFALAPSGFTSQGSQPSAGPSGSKIQLRISGQYDLLALTSTPPYAWVLFGNAASRTPAQMVRESPVDASGACTYSITVDAPAFLLTNWTTASNVPLTVVVESADGNELARVGSAGSFTYTDPGPADVGGGQGGGGDASPPDEGAGVTRSVGRSTGTRSPTSHEHEAHAHQHQVNSPPSLTVRTSASTSPATEHGLAGVGVGVGVGTHPHHHGHLHHHHQQQQHDVADPTGTNTYGYPPAPSQLHQVPQATAQTTSFGAYGQPGSDTMLHAYRTSNSYSHQHQHQHQYQHQHQHQRSPTSLRSPQHALPGGWASYGGVGAGYSSSTHHHQQQPQHHHHHHQQQQQHTSITRPSLTPSLPMPSGGPPALVRTTSLPQGNPGMGLGGPGVYSPFGSHHKAVLHIQGNLDHMSVNWTNEEWENKRRIVIFKKTQSGSRLTATFRAVPVNERPPNSICISCIWWEDRQECFVTSVDTIHLLEQLVAAPNRFTVEEKNRIRRNLEGFKPLTVSKAKSDSEDFFKVIMGFGNPKPRNIEKDVKVFPWKVLAAALKKIISKYSASPSSTMPQSTHHPSLLTPASVASSGGNYGLPPTPTTATDPAGYLGGAGLGGGHHHGSLSESIPSPRSLTSGGGGGGGGGGGAMHPSWAAYPGTAAGGARDVGRALSPTAGLLKTSSSPGGGGGGGGVGGVGAGLRLSALPAAAYDARGGGSQAAAAAAAAAQYGLSAQQGAGHAAAGRWDYSVNAISDTTGTYGGGARGGYDYGAYGDGASQRT